MTFVEAAYTILKSEGSPLAARGIVNRAISRGLLKTQGKTPHATIWACLYEENKRRQKRGQQPRFKQHENAVWGLTEWK